MEASFNEEVIILAVDIWLFILKKKTQLYYHLFKRGQNVVRMWQIIHSQ